MAYRRLGIKIQDTEKQTPILTGEEKHPYEREIQLLYLCRTTLCPKGCRMLFYSVCVAEQKGERSIGPESSQGE